MLKIKSSIKVIVQLFLIFEYKVDNIHFIFIIKTLNCVAITSNKLWTQKILRENIHLNHGNKRN